MGREDRIELKAKVNRLPRKPGIYFFKNKEGVVVYIGKARSLRERVKSYWAPTTDPKVHSILAETIDIDYLLTDSEKEASFLENNFIQQYQPKFNIKLKDDKAFPFLKVSCQDKFPGIYLTRRVEADGARYFGPFSPAHQARKNIHLVNKYFGIRNCLETITGKRKRPCLEYDLEFCSAPCVGYISEEEYKSQVDSALLFLEGKSEELLKILKHKMREAADSQEFERAALWRDLILSLEQLKEKPKLISVKKEDKDILGFSTVADIAYISLFRMREGKVIESEIIPAKREAGQTAAALLASKLMDYYRQPKDIPDKIILPFHLEKPEELVEILSRTKAKKVEFITPVRGENKKLMELATRNAAIYHREESEELYLLLDLKNALELKSPPHRIEGFDISNTGGDESVGSLVVFEGGRPLRSKYKKYKIKTVAGPDDVASLGEVLRRRYSSLLTQGREFFPDLILVDGGKGQLGAALKALSELGIKDQAVASIAKKEEIIFVPSRKTGILLDRTSPALKLIQSIRDEAHRFAISYHRRRRQKKSFVSTLDNIQGIGPKRKALLLREFKGIEGIKKASQAQLAKWVGPKTATKIRAIFKNEKG